MPCPRPVLAPVTTATLPASEKGFVAVMGSLQLANIENTHIGVVEIFAAHRPDEAVVPGARAHVNRPGRRHHRFFVANHDTASVIRLSHEVHNALIALAWLSLAFEIEVEINLGTPIAKMRRHGVP